MLRSLTNLAKALPLCCGLMFIAAAEDDCTIRILTEEDDGEEECEEVDSVCNLDCELATNDEGCQICACVDPPPPPEGCESDADCREGQACQDQGGCPPCANDPDAPCDIACTFEGVCVDVNPDPCAAVLCSPDTFCAVDESGQAVCLPINQDFCTSDEECGEERFCDFSQCGGSDGNRPAPPDEDGDGEGDALCAGVCSEREPPFGCENVLCDEGTHCIEDFFGPTCVPNDSECNVDEDCGDGAHCEITCQSDPSCPNCDVCLVVGQCVQDNDECAALCGPGSECRVNDDGSVECAPIDPPQVPECTSDEQCENGATCNAADVCMSDPACADPGSDGNDLVACTDVCWGFCVAPEPTSCQADADCGENEICEVRDSCAQCEGENCFVPCFVEGVCVPG